MKNSNNGIITQEKFYKLCHDGYNGSNILRAVLWILTAGSLICIFGSASQGNKDDVFKFIAFFINLLAVSIAFNFIVAIFDRLRKSPTPFTYDIADKFRGISNILLMGFAVYIVYAIIILVFSTHKQVLTDYNLFITIGYIAADMITKCFEYIFSYGAALQQQADETL